MSVKNKNILIIGSSLYGCLLAYQYSKKKNYKVFLIESAKKILNSLNSIKIKSLNINNGFHNIEIPRARSLNKFLKEKLKVKINTKDKIFKILINNQIIDYKSGLKEWPQDLIKDLKKKFTITRKNNLEDFYNSRLLKLVNICSKRYNDKSNEYKHLFIPWFLPKEYRLQSSDEGDIFRQKVRRGKIKYMYSQPKNILFQVLQKKFSYFLNNSGVKIICNTNVILNKKNIIIKKKNVLSELNNYKFDKVFFCAPAALILKSINSNCFNKLNIYKRFLQNVILTVDKNINFTEMICINKKLPYLNRISVIKNNSITQKSTIQLEIINIKENITSNEMKLILSEVQNIFHLKKKPIFFGYKTSRIMFFPSKTWINEAMRIIKNWKKKSKLNFKMRYSFGPHNMAKAWKYSVEDSNI